MVDTQRSGLRRFLRASSLWLLPVPVLFLVLVDWRTVGDPLQAMAWHARHGNHATFADHNFRLPLFWRSTNPNRGEIFRRSPTVQLNLDHSTAGVRTLQQAQAYQKQLIAMYGKGEPEGRYVPETIHTPKVDFLCVRENSPEQWALYLCIVPGTDWQIGLTGGPAGLDAAREILASVQ